jgi:hypothetical protein
MRIHPTDPRLFLVELSDFRTAPLPQQVQENLEPLNTVVDWARDYLCRPHPELGRTGAVCPFTQPALRRNLFMLTVIRGSELHADDVQETVRLYRDWFLEMPPHDARQAQYKTINILFPDLPESAWKTVIEAVQERLKAEYVPHGIMIGEFHPGPPDKAALWNEDFRPLRCPLPMLAIRHMVPTDFVFLRDRQDFMSAYLRLHGARLPPQMAPEIRSVAAAFGLAIPGEVVAPPQQDPPVDGCPVHASEEPVLTSSGA